MDPETNNESYNADELVAPDWLNTQFFEEVLRKHDKATELKITDLKISPASGKGDHYASIMFRGNVTYTTEKGDYTKSLIVKTMPEQDCHKKEMLGNSHIFETEIGMYAKVMPKFEQILREVGDNTRLGVPCLYHSLEPHQVLIFEDLVLEGYEVVRDREATTEEVKAALAKLAKWHAVSFQILHETPEFFEEFKYGLFDMPNLLEDPYMNTGMSNFVNFLDKVPELAKYKPHFKKMEGDYLDSLRNVWKEYSVNRQPNGYYVLGHSDCHLRNMMYKHNKITGALEDCMLLDFQLCNVCPISIDMLIIIYMLMGPEDRWNNHKQLINVFFDGFIETLQKIGFKGELPNSVEFWRQISSHKYYDFFIIATYLPMLYGLKSKEYEITDILTNEELRQKLYFSEIYIEELKHLLPRFEREGYFE